METILKKGNYKILKMFYHNGNSPVHLRGISRSTRLNENSTSRFLNSLTNSKVLISRKNKISRNFFISEKFVKVIFSFFDFEKFENLDYSRKKAVEDYLFSINKKPLCLILFGSTSRGNSKKNSDLDILEINDSKEKVLPIIKKIESQRGVRLQVMRVSQDNLKDFSKEDKVFMSAVETGFPIFGTDFFYKILKNERKDT